MLVWKFGMDPQHFAAETFRRMLLPPLNLFLVIGAGAIVRRWRPRLGRSIGIAGWILLVVLCTEAGSRLLVAPLEALTRPILSIKPNDAQAIVVLSAGGVKRAPEYGGQNVPDYIALARLRYAAKLQHETGLPILVTGGSAMQGDEYEPEAPGMARALVEDFRTPVKWVETNSKNTAENATSSAAILRRAQIRRIFLVTDSMHMPRSQMAFACTGLEVVAAPTVFKSAEKMLPLEFVPSAEGLRRSYYATYEWLGLALYWLRGDIRC